MEAWQMIPIFLINRNRHKSLVRMIDWLLQAGCVNIRILDNDSSYPPLLDYYRNLPAQVTLVALGKNIGPWVLWQLGLHREMKWPYIVSDADLVPADFCPQDLIPHLVSTISRFPDCGKVGPGLRIDNIHPNYGQRETALRWESQFWHRPVARGIFAAPIDTTFAIYAAGAEFENKPTNLRLGYPYLMDHTPWQVDEAALDDEEQYYRTHVERNFSYWSNAAPDQRLADNPAVANYEARPTILHLGCGNENIPGWVNIDVAGRLLDARFDLDSCRAASLPLEADSVDGFYMSHVFEHVRDTLSLMQELHRVAKDGARMQVRLPHGASNDAWEDPTHARPYFESSFVYFSQPAYSRADYGYHGDWQVDRITLVVDPETAGLDPGQAMNRIQRQRNVVREMIVDLVAVKPARPRLYSLLRNGAIYLTADERIAPAFSCPT